MPAIIHMIDRISGLAKQYKLFIKYTIAGSMGAFVDLVFLYLFADILGIWYLTASVLAFLVAFMIGFTLQKFWTFRCRDLSVIYEQLLFYFITGIICLSINSAAMYVLVDKAGIYHIFAQILAGGVVAVVSFSISYFITFRKSLPAKLEKSGTGDDSSPV